MCLALCLVALLSIAYVAYPIRATVDANQPVVTQSTSYSFIGGYNVSATRTDTVYASGAHYVSFDILVDSLSTFSGRFGRSGGSIYELTTNPIPYSQLLLLLNSADSSNSTSLDGPPPDPSLLQYQWNGITFVQAGTYEYQGASLWIKYDHPDNYEIYHLNPNGSPDVNDAYTIKGTNGHDAYHFDKQQISAMQGDASIAAVVGVLVGVAGAAMGFGPPGWVVGAVTILIGALLAAVGTVLSAFISNIVTTELGDGWGYMWGVGHWNCWFFHSYWFDASFGSWRDWSWFFFLSNFAGCYAVPI